MNEYLNTLKYERKLSHNTILSYTLDLTEFNNYIHKDSLQVTKEDIESYLKSRHHLSATTRAHNFTVIQNYYLFCLENNFLKVNPCETIHLPKLPEHLPVYLTYEEVDKLLNIPLNTPYDYRTKAMLELLYATGMRISELISLRFSNIDIINDCVRVEGKGSKERVIPFNDSTASSLTLYLNTYRPM